MLRLSESTGIVVAMAIRMLAIGAGMTFLLLGVCGFVSGCVDHDDLLRFAGPDSGALLFGVFEVSVLHNVVHLVLGMAGLAASGRAETASRYLVIAGLLCLLLCAYGMVVTTVAVGSPANLLPDNRADNWLYLGLAVALSSLGLLTAYPARLAARSVPAGR